jgi:hypothetical protein
MRVPHYQSIAIKDLTKPGSPGRHFVIDGNAIFGDLKKTGLVAFTDGALGAVGGYHLPKLIYNGLLDGDRRRRVCCPPGPLGPPDWLPPAIPSCSDQGRLGDLYLPLHPATQDLIDGGMVTPGQQFHGVLGDHTWMIRRCDDLARVKPLP